MKTSDYIEVDFVFNKKAITNRQGVTLLFNYNTGNTASDIRQLHNMDMLYHIRNLDDGWNGYGSERINDKVIDIAENIIKNIYIQPSVYPTGRNSIQMQYELEDRSYLEFEIFEEKIVCMEVPKRIYSDAVFRKINGADMEKINEIVKEFYEGKNTRE